MESFNSWDDNFRGFLLLLKFASIVRMRFHVLIKRFKFKVGSRK